VDFFAVVENYPELQANTNFMALQQRISQLENQIADCGEFYNDCANTFNIRIQQVPDTFVAGFMHLTPRAMLKVDEADESDVHCFGRSQESSWERIRSSAVFEHFNSHVASRTLHDLVFAPQPLAWLR
jgi:hypothetical protein